MAMALRAGCDGLVQASLVPERGAQVVERLGVVRPEGECTLEAGDGLVQSPLVPKRCAQVVVCLWVVRPEGECPLVAGDGLVQPSLFPKRNAQIVVCLRVVRIENQGLAVGGHCLIQQPLLRKYDAQAGMVRSYAAVGLDRGTDQVKGRIMVSRLVGNDPEQVQAVCMAGIGRQNLPAAAFSFAQAPGLMMVNSVGEQPLKRRPRSLHHGTAELLFQPALFAIHAPP